MSWHVSSSRFHSTDQSSGLEMAVSPIQQHIWSLPIPVHSPDLEGSYWCHIWLHSPSLAHQNLSSTHQITCILFCWQNHFRKNVCCHWDLWTSFLSVYANVLVPKKLRIFGMGSSIHRPCDYFCLSRLFPLCFLKSIYQRHSWRSYSAFSRYDIWGIVQAVTRRVAQWWHYHDWAQVRTPFSCSPLAYMFPETGV